MDRVEALQTSSKATAAEKITALRKSNDTHSIEDHLIRVFRWILLDVRMIGLQTFAQVNRTESNVQVQTQAVLGGLLTEIDDQRLSNQSE